MRKPILDQPFSRREEELGKRVAELLWLMTGAAIVCLVLWSATPLMPA